MDSSEASFELCYEVYDICCSCLTLFRWDMGVCLKSVCRLFSLTPHTLCIDLSSPLSDGDKANNNNNNSANNKDNCNGLHPYFIPNPMNNFGKGKCSY